MITQSWRQNGGGMQAWRDTAARPGIVRRVAAAAIALATLPAAWIARRRQRDLLLRLDDRMLRDIGLTRSSGEHEAMKPFWRP